MWQTEYSATTNLPVEAVWGALRDVHTGAKQSGGGDTFEIHGPYELGTEISVTPQGQETFRSTITELVPNQVYADQTQFGDLLLTFRHTFRPDAAGTLVVHELVIDGESADTVGPELGPQISEDFPSAMQSLFDLAAASVAAGAPTVGS